MVFRRWMLVTASLVTVIAMGGLTHPGAAAAERSLAPAATQCAKPSGALHVRGVRVYDASGKQFISYGVTLAGLAYPSYATLMPAEEAAIVASATTWCANTVRLQVGQDLLVGADGKHFSQTFMNAVATEVTLAEKYGLAVVLNPQTEAFGGEPAPTAATIAFWQVMANAYGHDPKVIFDVFNEPRTVVGTCDTPSNWQLWQRGGVYKGKRYLGEQQLVSSVRGADKAPNLIWVEPSCGSFQSLRTHLLTGTDIVYSMHHPTGPPHSPGTWDSDYGFLLENNIAPVVEGEWTNYSSSRGECWADAPVAVPRYLAWLTRHGIGMSGWSLVKGVLIESDNPSDPTVIRSDWRCANGLNEGAGALLMAWFNRQNKISELVNQAHGLCLDAASQHDDSSGDRVQLLTCDGADNQFWSLAGSGPSYAIVNEAHGLCLDAASQHDGSGGDKVQLWNCNGGSNQQWTAGPGHIFRNGAHHLCLDAQSQHDGSDGDFIQLWRCNGLINQEWN